ncbi:hypothetical protein [Actinosynnema mirum]|uniref:Uncharacterized protein n=1 Tax=Actinosynnema mirum (strain ATCC 29888 / DSM 43827 / JCM 3225 / NBRC 14064 / NCIMB 13271 / NRRL B-12336 / IMRU 3971 / 101) TaxID=446462 RepID=C6WI57_ACTMD|nr:hypothetical protein [Actinosynnema mirum]ACU34508.1 hypothetical protein Amir_0541 [Actinosynnema mirum DSM 43827]
MIGGPVAMTAFSASGRVPGQGPGPGSDVGPGMGSGTAQGRGAGSAPVPGVNSGFGGALSAAERYKEVVELAGDAVERMRQVDRERVAQLIEALAESQIRMAAAIDREKVAELGVDELWQQAVEALWEERSIESIGQRPRPDQTVPPRDQLEYDNEVELAYRGLVESLAKRSLFRGGKS